MKNGIYLLALFLISCGGKKIPDVSNVAVSVSQQRFEQDFFSIDTASVTAELERLYAKYPSFLPAYVQHILGLPLLDDSVNAELGIKMFIRDYSSVKQEADLLYKDFTPYTNQIVEALKYVKYYFPEYHTPQNVLTFIGPFDAVFQTGFDKTGDIITEDALAIGLQLHLGSDAPVYQNQAAQALFPLYVSRKFNPETIVVNSMKNVVDDIYQGPAPKTLLDHLIDKGKRQYLLDLFLPKTADHEKLGYTKEQLKGCVENESLIWTLFMQNDLLYNSDPSRMKHYIEEGPYTQELGEQSPGQIAQFTGWQIVKKYMDKFPETSLKELLDLSPQKILQDAKYKPR